MMRKQEALEVLARPGGLNDIIATYKIAGAGESSTVPGAMVVDRETLHALKVLRDYASTSFVYIAVTPHGWGKDVNPLNAVERAKRQTPRGRKTGRISLYRATADTELHGDNSWSFPQGIPPELIEEA